MKPFEYIHHDIFDFLQYVRQRPRMWVSNLRELEAMIYGYYTGIDMHGIHEDVPQMSITHFGIWLRHKTKWSRCTGWARMIEEKTKSDEEAFDTFFDYVDQYRQLKPTVRAKVKLKPYHQPTGKRVTIGLNGKMERPDEIHIVNYAPTRLHHFRYIYCDRIFDDWFHQTSIDSHSSRPKDLFEWAKDEFGIEPDEWNIVRNSKK